MAKSSSERTESRYCHEVSQRNIVWKRMPAPALEPPNHACPSLFQMPTPARKQKLVKPLLESNRCGNSEDWLSAPYRNVDVGGQEGEGSHKIEGVEVHDRTCCRHRSLQEEQFSILSRTPDKERNHGLFICTISTMVEKRTAGGVSQCKLLHRSRTHVAHVRFSWIRHLRKC